MRYLQRGSWASNPIIPPVQGAEFFTFEQLQTRTIEALKGYVRRRLGGYGVAIKDVPTTNRLYRGVKWSACQPRTIEDLSYPKPDIVRDYGRANRIGQSMFYGCLGAFPVFLEIQVQEGDLVALSEWSITEPLWMHNLGYHPDALEVIGAPIPPQRFPLINPIPNETKRNYRLRRKMSLAFTKDVPDDARYRYKETIAINELLFDRASPIPSHGLGAPRSEHVAGTVYPTVRMQGLADNVAIWPKFVDRYLKVQSVRYIRVESVDHEKLTYDLLTLAHSTMLSGGTIIWREELPPERERRTHVAFEGGRWIFRDGLGRIYDRH
jgi:hypothetical protein